MMRRGWFWRWLRRALVIRLCLALVMLGGDAPRHPAHASTGGIGSLVGTVIENNAASMGWSFSDATSGKALEATIEAVGEQFFKEGTLSAVEGFSALPFTEYEVVAAGVATAPEWLPILAGAAVVAGGAIVLAKGYAWLTNTSANAVAEIALGPGVDMGQAPVAGSAPDADYLVCSVAQAGILVPGNDPLQPAGPGSPTQYPCSTPWGSVMPEVQPMVGFTRNVYKASDSWATCSGYPMDVINCEVAGALQRFQNEKGIICDAVWASNAGFSSVGDFGFGLMCEYPASTGEGLTSITIQAYRQNVPESGSQASKNASQVSAALDPNLVAQAVNKAWHDAAAQPGYQGVPFTQPVTAGQVAQVEQTMSPGDISVSASTQPAPVGTDANGNPTIVLSSPHASGVAATSGGTSSTTTTQSGNCDGTYNCNQINIDLGPDPGTAQPSLETAPSASAILAPLLNLLPGLRSFQVPAHQSSCPTATFTLFGKSYVMDQQCTLFSGLSSQIAVIMAAVWAIISGMIVLSA